MCRLAMVMSWLNFSYYIRGWSFVYTPGIYVLYVLAWLAATGHNNNRLVYDSGAPVLI